MIKSVWVEIRPTLKCCHFCIIFSKEISSEVKITVKRSSLEFAIKEAISNVSFKDFTVEPLTVRDFKLKHQHLSFRIQADCHFKFDKHLPPVLAPPAFYKDKISLLCQCYNPLTTNTSFERVLPLPSNDFSFSDLFCHLPNGTQAPSITPRLNDCFYSDDFFVISRGNLRGCTKNEKFVKCTRCLTTVGVTDKNTAKFFVSCIKFPFNNPTLLEQFKHIVQRAISNPVIMFPKILLQCEENKTYLSIVVVDKNLVVSNCEENLILENNEAVKLKYKFHTYCDSDVKLLQEDPCHTLHQVHKSLMDFSTKLLISCCKTIPSLFGKMENECMAYVNL